ncbi:MAG: hypothetical protein H6Q89_4784 [Myxococcaceae bacterium]|nr:hypothetical protein [Myxococcaceae bacterium]
MDELTRWFEAQHGLVTRVQALKLGLSRRAIDWRLQTREWEVARTGVYRLSGSHATWDQRAHAAMLWSCGAASHRTAARLWNLDLTVPDDAPLEMVTRIRRNRTAPDVIVHRSRTIELRDLTERRGIRVTRLGTTLLHLAQVLPLDLLEAALDSAIRNRPPLQSWLASRLQGDLALGMRGKALRHMVLAREFGTFDSLLEVDTKQALERAWLPPTHVHYPLAAPFHTNLDFVWEPQRVALQMMGMKGHGSRRRFDLTLQQLRELAARGWTVLPATWTDLHEREAELMADLARALAASGVSLDQNVPAWIFKPRQELLFPISAVDLSYCTE